jgi:hypothetical protein
MMLTNMPDLSRCVGLTKLEISYCAALQQLPALPSCIQPSAFQETDQRLLLKLVKQRPEFGSELWEENKWLRSPIVQHDWAGYGSSSSSSGDEHDSDSSESESDDSSDAIEQQLGAAAVRRKRVMAVTIPSPILFDRQQWQRRLWFATR